MQRSRKSAFSNISRNSRECKIRKKWSWKIHGKIFCQVCGNPEEFYVLFRESLISTTCLNLAFTPVPGEGRVSDNVLPDIWNLEVAAKKDYIYM